jgi:hypothetical protein
MRRAVGCGGSVPAVAWPGLAAVTARARELTDADQPGAAAGLLAGVLAGLDPVGMPAVENLVVAGLLYAEILDGVPGAGGTRVAWVRYAYRASVTLWGRRDRRGVDAARALAAVSARTGHAGAEVALRRGLTAVDGPDGQATVQAREELAECLHRAGRCREALRELSDAWRVWSAGHGVSDPIAVVMQLRLAAFLTGCGELPTAAQWAARARAVFPPEGTFTRILIEGFAEFRTGLERDHDTVCGYRPDPWVAYPVPASRDGGGAGISPSSGATAAAQGSVGVDRSALPGPAPSGTMASEPGAP